ncbi:CapA family protein [Lactiplantibacillus paraplantarum]|uniref:CapA family protein n=1 Tax=Lactiplantibacillus paraplantarum TaxID=60520 RepID=UPI003DA5D051
MTIKVTENLGLNRVHPTTQKVSQFQVKDHQVTIINDTHNAELLAVKNFIKFAQNYPTKADVKKVFIAGRVINSRNDPYKAQLEVVNLLNSAGFEKYYLYGPEFDMVIPAAKQPAYGGYYTTPKQIVHTIAQALNQDLVIFIKADSHEDSIERVQATLKKELAYDSSAASRFAMTTGLQNHQAYTRCGVGRLLVILQCLQKIASGQLRLTAPVTIQNALLKDHSINKVGLKVGERYTVYDLVTLAIVFAAPDVLINLAEYSYGSNQKAFSGLKTFAKKLGLSADTVHNITGRPTRRAQKTYLADLEKIGDAFIKLPNEVLSLLSTQRRQLNGKLYQKKTQLFKTGKIIGSVFLDGREHAGLYFWLNQQGKHRVAFINSPHPAYVDCLVENVIDSGVTQRNETYPVTSLNLTNPIVNILADTYFGEDYTRKRQRRGIEDGLQKYGYAYSFNKIQSFFEAKHYNVLNFEAVFASGASPLDAVKPFVLDANADKTLAEFKRLGFNLAMLGNNHANDYGSTALVDTMAKFKQASMQTIGAGRNQLESRRVIELMYDGRRYAIFNGYWYRNPAYNLFNFYAKTDAAGVNCLDTMMATDIRRYKQLHPNAKVIVSAHWGTDYGEIHNGQRETAERLTLAGADLIIGHGPHRLQPIEYYGQTPVLYSIGNGVFNNSGSFKQLKVPPYAAIVRLDLSQNQLYWCPIYADNSVTFWQPSFVSDVDFEQIRAINPAHFETVKLDGEINAVVIPF